MEGLAPDKYEYTIENFWETVQELQPDIDCLTEEFKFVAQITVMIH